MGGIINMVEMKKILNDILEYAYPNSERMQDYKRFYVELFKEKDMKSKHGDYHSITHKIRIFNLYRDDAAIIATTIHELAHHVDNCNRGTTNHDSSFYAVFKELLFTAMNMNLFNKELFLQANKDASDSNKITKMIAEYEPEDVGYKKDTKRIVVRNCYAIKEKLKERNYHYNSLLYTWEKEVVDTSEEENFLQSENAQYDIVDATSLSLKKKRYIYAKKGSYESRNELKEAGFQYDGKKKIWKIEVQSDIQKELNEHINNFPTVQFDTK